MKTLAAIFASAGVALAADYTTYIGDAYPYHVTAMTTDSNGVVYVTGGRAVVSLQPGTSLSDVFVARLDAAGNPTLVATLSGKGSDEAHAIALDPAGNIYLGGVTTSANFPTHHALQTAPAPRNTGFVVKLSAGGDILYATYFGGVGGSSAVNGIAADSQGNAYVTGTTFSPDFAATPGLPNGPVYNSSIGPISGAFFAKISATGDKIIYAGVLSTTTHACGAGSTCFLSPIATNGVSVAVDSSGNAYIAGNTYGANLATTAGALRTDGIGAFVAKVNAAGTGMAYVTLLGNANNIPGAVGNSNPGNLIAAIAADVQGNAYISGSTFDPNFPVTPGAYQTRFASILPPNPFVGAPPDAFIAKLNPTGSAMVWATFLGGSQSDAAETIAVDPKGQVWVSGTTSSNNFPASDGFPNGAEFLAELSSDGANLVQSNRFPAQAVAGALALDPGGAAHTGGSTGLISTFTPGAALGSRFFGIMNAAGGPLAGRAAPGEVIAIFGLHLGPSTPLIGQPANGFMPTSLGGVQITINGTALPLLYVSDSQINAVAPIGLVSPGVTALHVTGPSAPPDFRLRIDAMSPQVFRNPDGSAAAINEDGTVNSEANPAPVGSFVAIWATGTGATPLGAADGQIPTAASPCCNAQILLSADNTQTEVFYAGAAPGLVTGVVQINFEIPPLPDILSGVRAPSFYLVTAPARSDPFQIFVKQ